MEPTKPNQASTPEASPAPTGGERLQQPAAQSETAPQPAGGAPATGPAPAASAPTTAPDPKSQPPQKSSKARTPVTGPATASDQDVIEPEWVHKAEEVIKKTAGQPREEEDAVEDLQVDYLQKRYGKDITKPEAH